MKNWLIAIVTVLGCVPFSAADGVMPKLRVCLVSGSTEYNSDESLAGLKAFLNANPHCEATLLKARRPTKIEFLGKKDPSEPAFDDLPGLEALDTCDVALFFTRRLTLPPEQLARVKRYCSLGRPLVAVRTASHGFQNWLEFDRTVLGGDYGGHSKGAAGSIHLPAEISRQHHPLLAGVHEFSTSSTLYKNAKLAADAYPFLFGSTNDFPQKQPVAWARINNGGRVVYTSLGNPDDFANPNFRQLLINALYWSAHQLPRVSNMQTLTAAPMSVGFAPLENTSLTSRHHWSLNSPWQFRRDKDPATNEKTVTLPCVWEEHEGIDWNGIGWYRKVIAPIKLAKNERLLLRFQAVATVADVYWNGVKLGSHVGGWTPFSFDVTSQVRNADSNRSHEISIRVDEKVGHHSQGFLPIIAPHFGGIWQSIELVSVPQTYVDENSIRLAPNWDKQTCTISANFLGDAEAPAASVRIIHENRTAATGMASDFATTPVTAIRKMGSLTAEIPIANLASWDPSRPELHRVQIILLDKARDSDGRTGDVVTVPIPLRRIETVGTQFRLNGKPLQIRGVLNWGYYPPGLSPDGGEERFRGDLKYIKSLGFNTMKFCLWIPPKRFLELCDEMGVLAWIEYPTWHAEFSQRTKKDLLREYTEFFTFDRNHPSVILRSLTCETGHNADLDVIKSLYDLGKQMVPGSLIEDDSSWIGWHRITDFYDDHPYGNNHTWVETLRKLKDHIKKNGEKPLVLGEAIAADTWVDPEPILKQVGDKRPFWVPKFLDANTKWLERMKKVAGPDVLINIGNLDYADQMRKYQIETFRREFPDGGYVVSELRDFPLASMGLIDYQDQPKKFRMSSEGVKVSLVHGETMFFVQTEGDRRSFYYDQPSVASLWVSHHGDSDLEVFCQVAADWGQHPALELFPVQKVKIKPHTTKKLSDFEICIPKQTSSSGPRQISLIVRTWKEKPFTPVDHHNWTFVYAFPSDTPDDLPIVQIHKSVPKSLANELSISQSSVPDESKHSLWISTVFDQELLRRLEAGANVLFLPSGRSGSLPLQSHWFLRGGPVTFTRTYPQDRDGVNQISRLGLLQHFDLASDVIPDVKYLEEIDPILMLWDNHDIDHVKTHGLIFETRVGKGKLLVSAVNHTGKTNAAGKWLFHQLLKHLASDDIPRHAFSEATIQGIRDKLVEEKVDLTARPWKFQPDPSNDGLARKFDQPSADLDKDLKPIRVGQHWESQGYQALDGWAWYRIHVELPRQWGNKPIYFCLEGADDYYEVFVNGTKIGSGGDIANKKTAFADKNSLRLPDGVHGGSQATIAVRVYDWYGAGGLHRPIWLSNTPIRETPEVIK